jgi:hypothetical protein
LRADSVYLVNVKARNRRQSADEAEGLRIAADDELLAIVGVANLDSVQTLAERLNHLKKAVEICGEVLLC